MFSHGLRRLGAENRPSSGNPETRSSIGRSDLAMQGRAVLHPVRAAERRPHRPLDATRRTVLRPPERFLTTDDRTDCTTPRDSAMTTLETTSATLRRSTGVEIDAAEAKRLLAAADTVLVDCREADEHARERIAGARLVPLSALTVEEIAGLGAKRVILHCRSGRRSLDAATRCAGLADRGIEVRSLTGGIEGWKSAGFGTEVDATRPKLGVMQQTQLTIGICVAAGTALGFFVHPGFLALPAFMGLGLVFAGATGFCGLATLLAKAPWNRVPACSAGSCCNG